MRSLYVLVCSLLLSACAGIRYTVDDGRKVDEALLANIRTYGAVEQRLRPAIVRGTELNDASCDRHWQLPFALATSYGWPENERVAWVRVVPFQVCRGYARLAPPNLPQAQDYHWLMSMHSLQLGEIALTADEALWIVLWSQGLSEEGGARMKTFHYSVKIVGTLYNLATLVSGLKGAAMAAQAAKSAVAG